MDAPAPTRIKVLVVDDSAIVRRILSDTIAAEPDMEVVAAVPDAYVAHESILALQPDVLTLDIAMPRMDGITFLKRLMRGSHPIPAIIISALDQASCAATLDALRCGAVDVVAKPAGPYSVGDLRRSLAAKIRGAAGARPRAAHDLPPELRPLPAAVPSISLDHPRTVIAIGASTGGTVAIQEILLRLPADMPPIVITQHIPPGFSAAFANRLNKLCALEVREAADGDILRRGLALLAPGDRHLLLRRTGSGYAVELERGPEVCYQRPSVDAMFHSVARAAGGRSIAVLLTGMGADGAKGMLALHSAGGATLAQDEASCVIYGMPREAVRLGAVDTIAPLADIPALLTRAVRPLRPSASASPVSSPATQEPGAASHPHRAAQEDQP